MTTTEVAARLQLDEPKAPRVIRPPVRFEQTLTPTAAAILTPEESLRRISFQVIDILCAELTRRFSSINLQHLASLESMLLLSSPKSAGDVSAKLGPYKDDLDAEKLYIELSVLQSLIGDAPTPSTVTQVAQVVSAHGEAVQWMLPEMRKAISLFLCIPAIASSAERTFSVMKILKSCLRNSMSASTI
jgi:hypothetical protein